MNTPLLRLSGVAKSFGGVRALVRGELELHAGQVTALIGENGAGKSTLVKILTGIHTPDAGVIELDGRPLTIRSPQDAQRLGISVIHQESVVFDDLSVAENIFAAREQPAQRTGTAGTRTSGLRAGLINWRQLHQRAAELLAQLDARIDTRVPLGSLSIAEKHLVQIARALSQEARIVIMDEPTAALSHHETEDLLKIVRRLRGEGRAVLYISHKFEEIFAVADRYATFRDGAAVGSGLIADTSLDELVKLMVGRPIDQVFPKLPAQISDELLRVENLSREPEFADVSFTLRRGEILGVYGLVGAGRTEVMHALFGMNRARAGRVLLEGQELRCRDPGEAISHGIVYVPEDRQSQGAILSRSICDNITLPSLAKFARLGFVEGSREAAAAREWVQRLQVKCADAQQAVGSLSGGNQQKVVLARWLLTAPRVLILDEPTKGIDVGSKAVVHRLMSELVQQGLGVIMVSSELPEVLGMADRILVMRRGRARGLFDRADANAENILRAATDA
jgi:rhamnose transport system ATP-binding protein